MYLAFAKLCNDCTYIYNDSVFNACPKCASPYSMRLKPILDRTETNEDENQENRGATKNPTPEPPSDDLAKYMAPEAPKSANAAYPIHLTKGDLL